MLERKEMFFNSGDTGTVAIVTSDGRMIVVSLRTFVASSIYIVTIVIYIQMLYLKMTVCLSLSL